MSHTPGPWKWDGDGEFLISESVPKDTPAIIVKHEAYGFASEADMALIAAAPDLLNACKAVMAWVEDSKYRDAVDILRAAIAKVDILRAAIAKAEHGT